MAKEKSDVEWMSQLEDSRSILAVVISLVVLPFYPRCIFYC
jgi:hypothetical protein